MKTWRLFNSLPLILVPVVAVFTAGCFDDPPEAAETEVSEISEPKPVAAPPPKTEVFVFSNQSKIRFGDPEDAESPAGGFSNFVGKLEVAGGELAPTGKHSLTIDMASVFTRDPQLTEQLKGDEFLANAFFPVARLSLDSAVPAGDNLTQLSGTFEFHGEAKAVTFPATVKTNGDGTLLDLSAEFPINWKDFGATGSEDLNWEEAVLRLEVVASPGEPRALELMPVGENDGVTPFEGNSSPQGQRPGFGKGDGKGRADWRNMTEEERAERRRQFIAEMDKNGDGNLAKDELSERMWQFMGQADKNGDDMVTETERSEYRAAREAERAMRELNGEEPTRGFGGGRPGGGGKGGGGDRGGDDRGQ